MSAKLNFRPLPSQADLRGALEYDPSTGCFRWKSRADRSARWNSRYAGTVAGARRQNGAVITFNFVSYYAHRLAWVYVHGDLLDTDTIIDHRNCDHFDNRIENLRPATPGENVSNSRLQRKKTLPKGVTKNRKCATYRADIVVNNQHFYLGAFRTIEAAHFAYVAAATKAKGQFARGE